MRILGRCWMNQRKMQRYFVLQVCLSLEIMVKKEFKKKNKADDHLLTSASFAHRNLSKTVFRFLVSLFVMLVDLKPVSYFRN